MAMPEFASPMMKLIPSLLDELASPLHGGADVVGRVLDQELNGTATSLLHKANASRLYTGLPASRLNAPLQAST
jgi:hypothetical protein